MPAFVEKFHKIRNDDGFTLMDMLIMIIIIGVVSATVISIVPKLVSSKGEEHVRATIQKIEPYMIKYPSKTNLLTDGISYKELADKVNSQYVPIVLERSIVKYTELDEENYELCITTESNNGKDLKYSTVDNEVITNTRCN